MRSREDRFEPKLTLRKGDLENRLWSESDPNGCHFTIRLFEGCGCTLPRELRSEKLVESWRVYPKAAKYLVSRRYANIEGEDGIWMTTIQMMVIIEGDGMVVHDTTEKEWTRAKSNTQFDECTVAAVVVSEDISRAKDRV